MAILDVVLGLLTCYQTLSQKKQQTVLQGQTLYESVKYYNNNINKADKIHHMFCREIFRHNSYDNELTCRRYNLAYPNHCVTGRYS